MNGLSPRSMEAAGFRWRLAAGPVAVLLLGLVVTFILAREQARLIDAREQAEFDLAIQRSQRLIEGRIDVVRGMLRGMAGLLSLEPELTAERFRDYLARLNPGNNYPGVQGIGYSRRYASRAALAAFARDPQGRVSGPFRAWPDSVRDEYHAIVLLEPQDRRNAVALGYDMFSEPRRRAAMERARDTGFAAASSAVTLVQEIDSDQQAGFLVFVPVYRTIYVPRTVEQRRAALLGFAYSPFRFGDFVRGVFGKEPQEIGMEIFAAVDPGAPASFSTGTAAPRPRIERWMTLDIGTRGWRVRYFSTPAFEARFTRSLVVATWGGGLLASVFAAVIVFWYLHRRLAVERENRAATHRFQLLADSAPVLVWMADDEQSAGWLNRQWLEFTGRGLAPQLGAGWLESVHPEDRPTLTREYRGAAGARDPFEAEFRLRRHDGAWRWVLGRGVPLALEAGGEFAGYIGTCVDITERREAEERQERALAVERSARIEAERVGRMKDEFLATLSHELRTPLSAILGWASILRRSPDVSEQMTKGLETIERNARTQARLIDDLLDVSRIVAGKATLEVQPLNLASIVEQVASSLRPAAEAKEIALEVDVDAGGVRMHGDPNRLQQVIWNLLSNAIKFTPRAGNVRVALHRSGDACELAVRDDGPGISSEFLPHVFDRFSQADASTTRRHSGLGLGLAIVKQLVELHGGTVSVDSPGEGLGTTFTVRLPRRAGETGALPAGAGQAPETSATAAPLLAGVEVVVVDDEPDTGSLLARILCDAGARVTTLGSAADALAQLESRRPDVLVSDIAMPDRDGYHLISRLRAREGTPLGDLPALAVTAFARPEDRRRALEAGFHAWLAKPVDPADLLTQVAALARRDLRQQRRAHVPGT